MSTVLAWLWRLIPGNPILLRVVEMAGKRRRDLWIRMGYLGLLVAIVVILLAGSVSSISGARLGELAKRSSAIFETISYVQLALVALLAPIFTAGAITQEKDSQTYDILLATPLTNGQIVLGSLLSRLFFVVALLISGIPIFSITQIFGGVAIGSIVLSFAIAAATAFVTGALAMALATFKVGTRRTIFGFYLFIVVYLGGLWLLDGLSVFRPYIDELGEHAHTSWFTGIHPFLALRVIFNEPGYTPPDIATLPASLQGWPIGYYLSRPHHFFVNFMFLLSLVLVLPSIVLLRRVAQSSFSPKAWLLQRLPRIFRPLARRDPRQVWHNPIAWREARTKASATRATLIRYAFIALGLAGAVILMVLQSRYKSVDAYILPRSFDPVEQALTIYEGNGSVTYRLASRARVTINKQPAVPEDLVARYAVAVQTQRDVRGVVITAIDAADVPTVLSADDTRDWLLGLAMLQVAMIVLIVTNAAASTVTREKEDGSLDLLLSTPITSRYYIWGKLRGLVSYVLPLIAVPVVAAMLFMVRDFLGNLGSRRGSTPWIVFPEAVIVLPVTLVAVSAFAAMVGMQMSLRCRRTVTAVMSSVGIVVGICAALGFCGLALLDGGSAMAMFRLALASFSPLTVVALQFSPYRFGGAAFEDPGDLGPARFVTFLFSLLACVAYGLVVWAMYRSMVKNFDMTIRRQHR